MVYFAYAMTWISTAMATVAGMYFTHSAMCLWALAFPAMIGFPYEPGDEVGDEEGQQ